MKKLLMIFFVALAVGFQSCDNNDDLWDAIDDLKGRVQALETQVAALNGNVEALQQLYSGATISRVEELTDKFVLTLTNGERIELAKGSRAEAVIPVIGIDENGQWRYSVKEGEWIPLGVKAEATDGKTPQFRIDETTGYWQVRYDATEEYTNVVDTQGQPVKAIGEGTVTDKFFDEARLDGDEFYVKLLDGTELRVPVVKDFFIRIVTATEGVQPFDAGTTKRFAVESKGVVNTVVTAPEGWKAFLTEAGDELVVTAPAAAAPASRAVADTSKDVAVQATSAAGFSAIAKIEVASSGEAPVAPTLSVAASTTVPPTSSSLTFDIETDGDSWKYLIRKTAVTTVPDAATIDATGTAGTGSSVTVDGLEASTAYTLYVVALKQNEPVLYSEVKSAEATTAEEPNVRVDYYAMYNNGETITVGDLAIDKATYGEAALVKIAEMSDAVFTTEGIAFIDDSEDTAGAGYTIASASNLNLAKIILIGRYADSQPVIRASAANKLLYCKVADVAGGFEGYNIVFKNLHIVSNTQYLLATSNAVSDPSVYIEDCTLQLKSNLFYDNNPNRCFANIYIANSIIEYANANKPLYAIPTSGNTTTKTTSTQKSMVLRNNVVYAAGNGALRNSLINLGSQAIGYATNDLEITLANNTIYNMYQINDMLVKTVAVKKIDAQYNVGFITETSESTLRQTYLIGAYTDSGSSGPYVASHNYLARSATDNNWNPTYGAAVTYTKTDNVLNDDAANPFLRVDPANGYFPINTGVVTNGAGASYDTKPWLKTN